MGFQQFRLETVSSKVMIVNIPFELINKTIKTVLLYISAPC